MSNNILSIEGNIVSVEGQLRKRVEIDQASGLITKVGDPTGSADFVFKEELIFPGFIDLHVHAREDQSHSQDYKEDFITAGEAAINGGVVAFAEMPNNPIPPIDDKSYKTKSELAKKCPVPVVLYAAISADSKPLSQKVPYKVFMGQSIGNLFFTSYDSLEEVIKNYEGQCISFHCEDPKILEENKNKENHEKRRPPEAEFSAIDFALMLIKKYNLQGKICHASTREGIEKIKKAKAEGVNVVAEVSPHHLYFDEEMLKEDNRNFIQMNPPVRTHADRVYLIEALREGAIDFIATDHAPHTVEEKLKGTSGTPQLDTYGPFTTWLIKEHNFTGEIVARVCSQNPGKFINQFTENKYGKIEENYAGSLTVIDMSKPVKITKDILKTKCGWSTYEGVTFPGSVVMTIIKGKIYGK